MADEIKECSEESKKRYNLIRLFKEKKLSQREIAKLLETDNATVNRLLKGNRNFTEKMLLKISKQFDVSTDFILGISPIKTNSQLSYHQKKAIDKIKRMDDESIQLLLSTIENMKI